MTDKTLRTIVDRACRARFRKLHFDQSVSAADVFMVGQALGRELRAKGATEQQIAAWLVHSADALADRAFALEEDELRAGIDGLLFMAEGLGYTLEIVGRAEDLKWSLTRLETH